MKVSEVTVDTVKNYIRVDYDQDDELIQAILIGSVAYIQSYTGLSKESLDLYEEITIALFVLCSEMYDNRSFSVDNAEVNPVVTTILSMHSTNYL
jgi:uncharacterized phage protein (predicted DNA packaging)